MGVQVIEAEAREAAPRRAPRGARRLGIGARFFLYGLLGWCVECFFTSLMDLASGAGDLRLMGYSYLWMHPIWGAGILASERLCPALRRAGLGRFTRVLVYMVLCFAVEYASGAALVALTGSCPWDYSHSAWSVQGLIRLDYAPFWALCGYLGEPLCSLMRRVRLSPPERLRTRVRPLRAAPAKLSVVP
jgi:hypothetical protein